MHNTNRSNENSNFEIKKKMLATTVGTIPLNCCIYNASGPRTGSTEALVKIARSHAGAVLSKSATLCKQNGNDMPRFINQVDLGSNYSQGSINSEGLPNLGIDYCKDFS
jgi:dihydroorotate dehydrogenase (fumarate)